jgi:phospholipid/cholesterol/gamma-HCH transport system substrate-binding protein
MENKAHALAAGLFVLLVSAMLVTLAVWLTRESGTRQLYEVSTSSAITGLQPQASVRFRGVKVGTVSDIGFDRKIPGNVLVRIAVDADAPITRSTFASLGFMGVTGIAFVQLDEAGDSKEPLLSSDGQPPRIPMRSGLVEQLAEQGTRLLTQIEETSRRANQLLRTENQQALMSSLGSLQQAAASVPPVMKEAGATLQSLREASGSVAGSAEEVKKTAAEFRQLSQRVQQPGGVLDQLSHSAGALSATGQALQADTLQRLNRTVDDTGRAARQLGRAAATLNDNPQALIYGSPSALPGPGEPGFVAPPANP